VSIKYAHWGRLRVLPIGVYPAKLCRTKKTRTNTQKNTTTLKIRKSAGIRLRAGR